MTIILDMGGVLMQHNMPECIRHFCEMLGEEGMANTLGMKVNAEGLPDSLMEKFECGLVTTEEFVHTILANAKEGTTEQQIIDAWNTMHAGIPLERIEQIKRWKKLGHHLLLLSNNNALHWEDIHAHYDMSIFDQCFASHLVHSHKPNKPIYEHIQKYLIDNQYEQPYYFVDDLEANRLMGETFGWKTYSCLDALELEIQNK